MLPFHEAVTVAHRDYQNEMFKPRLLRSKNGIIPRWEKIPGMDKEYHFNWWNDVDSITVEFFTACGVCYCTGPHCDPDCAGSLWTEEERTFSREEVAAIVRSAAPVPIVPVFAPGVQASLF